jgi:ferredoxin
MTRPIPVDPKMLSEVRRYGMFDDEGCFNCGSCTISCPLSNDTATFPRRCMRYVLSGAKRALLGSLEPWLCYYCGDCSEKCPRKAEPAESMMTLRRYLTGQFDWTGLAKMMYRSGAWQIGAPLVVTAIMIWLIAVFHGPVVLDRVALNTFAPPDFVHEFDLGLIVVLSFFLLSNIFRMYWYAMHPGRGATPVEIIRGLTRDGLGVVEHKGKYLRVPTLLFLTELKTFVTHLGLQLRFLKCANNKSRWRNHFLLVTGYFLMDILVIGLAPWFLTDNIYPIYHPQRWLGYYATAVLVLFGVESLIGRIKKAEPMHKYSQNSDWAFPILLLLTAVTGIFTHIFRYMGLPLTTYYTYWIHLAIAVALLVTQVPFGKWTHVVYRPLAIYLNGIRLHMPSQKRTRGLSRRNTASRWRRGNEQ